MIAYLWLAFFGFSALVTLTSLFDSFVRGRNAFRAIRAEMRSAQDLALPSFSADVVRLRSHARPDRVATQRLSSQPQRAAA